MRLNQLENGAVRRRRWLIGEHAATGTATVVAGLLQSTGESCLSRASVRLPG